MTAVTARESRRPRSPAARVGEHRQEPSETDRASLLLRIAVALAVIGALGLQAPPTAHG